MFFLTYILQYIFSLSKKNQKNIKTHAHTIVPFWLVNCGKLNLFASKKKTKRTNKTKNTDTHTTVLLPHFNSATSQAAAAWWVSRTQEWQRRTSQTETYTNQNGPFSKQCEHMAPLQRALGAATFQGRFHLLGVRAAVGAPENHLPPSALGDAAANTGGRCCLARPGTIHARDLAGGRARSQWLVTLELLPHRLPLTGELWTRGSTEINN